MIFHFLRVFIQWINPLYEIWIGFRKGGNDWDLTLEIKALCGDWDRIIPSMFLYSIGSFSFIRNTILVSPP